MPSSSTHHSSRATPAQQQQQQHHHHHHQQPPAAPLASIPVSQLGLPPSDAATLYQHQQIAHAQARSPAASQGSSQGRLLLDPGSLQLLSRHFDRVMQAIQTRLEALNEATELATAQQHDRAGNAIEMADREIRRFQQLLQQIDELELEFDKIQRIRDIVRSFRARVEGLEKRLG